MLVPNTVWKRSSLSTTGLIRIDDWLPVNRLRCLHVWASRKLLVSLLSAHWSSDWSTMHAVCLSSGVRIQRGLCVIYKKEFLCSSIVFVVFPCRFKVPQKLVFCLFVCLYVCLPVSLFVSPSVFPCVSAPFLLCHSLWACMVHSEAISLYLEIPCFIIPRSIRIP